MTPAKLIALPEFIGDAPADIFEVRYDFDRVWWADRQ
jgi:hypothetical protein